MSDKGKNKDKTSKAVKNTWQVFFCDGVII